MSVLEYKKILPPIPNSPPRQTTTTLPAVLCQYLLRSIPLALSCPVSLATMSSLTDAEFDEINGLPPDTRRLVLCSLLDQPDIVRAVLAQKRTAPLPQLPTPFASPSANREASVQQSSNPAQCAALLQRHLRYLLSVIHLRFFAQLPVTRTSNYQILQV